MREDCHVGACVVDLVHAAQRAADREAEVLECGGEDLRVLEEVASAPPAHELFLHCCRIDVRRLVEKNVNVREEKGSHVRVVQPGEQVPVWRTGDNTDRIEVLGDVEQVGLPCLAGGLGHDFGHRSIFPDIAGTAWTRAVNGVSPGYAVRLENQRRDPVRGVRSP